mgnify:CR=1 FL=1
MSKRLDSLDTRLRVGIHEALIKHCTGADGHGKYPCGKCYEMADDLVIKIIAVCSRYCDAIIPVKKRKR